VTTIVITLILIHSHANANAQANSFLDSCLSCNDITTILSTKFPQPTIPQLSALDLTSNIYFAALTDLLFFPVLLALLGLGEGTSVGCSGGDSGSKGVGAAVDGAAVGPLVGAAETGLAVGPLVGAAETGLAVGPLVGAAETGLAVGPLVGAAVGALVAQEYAA
jgi:hypothetical protein